MNFRHVIKLPHPNSAYRTQEEIRSRATDDHQDRFDGASFQLRAPLRAPIPREADARTATLAAMRSILLLSLLAACRGLVLPPRVPTRAVLETTRARVVMEAQEREDREKAAAERAAVVAERLKTAAAMDMSAEETTALTEASTSFEPCWTGKPEDCPRELINIYSQKPNDLFGEMRKPKEDPNPQAWLAVREKWPVLKERSDDELLAALQPIKDVPVDKRSLLKQRR